MSQHCEHALTAAAIGEAARAGDWGRVASLLETLARSAPPAEPEALAEYLDSLREALIAARISRAHLATRLHRIRAAASFG